MKEILILAVKGGVGKTTLTEAIRQCLAPVEIVDLDPQRSLSTALEMASVPLVPPQSKYRLYDSPPYNDGSLDQILTKVDHILIPARLGYPDLLAFRTVYERLLAAKAIHKALIVFNEVRKPLPIEAKEVLRLFRKNYPNVKIAKSFISRLEAFRKLFRFPIDGKAAAQISSLLAEIRINVVR